MPVMLRTAVMGVHRIENKFAARPCRVQLWYIPLFLLLLASCDTEEQANPIPDATTSDDATSDDATSTEDGAAIEDAETVDTDVGSADLVVYDPLPARTAQCTTAFDPSTSVAVPSLERETLEPSEENLMAWIYLLADESLHGREAGSEDAALVARLLADGLGAFGLESGLGTEEYCQPFELANGDDDQNVLGWYPGANDPDAPFVIVSAHYDHLGVNNDGVHFPGADDNASGVAALMEISRIVASAPSEWPVNILFVAFGAEELGLVGSEFYVENPPRPLDDVRMLINLDMVGRELMDGRGEVLFGEYDHAFAYVFYNLDAERTDEIMQAASETTGVTLFGVDSSVFQGIGFGSDSDNFAPYVPSVFLSSSIHSDYHKTTDTPENIVWDQLERATVVVLEALRVVAVEAP